jgi:type II secretory pathway component GspD/PulD (secretin)
MFPAGLRQLKTLMGTAALLALSAFATGVAAQQQPKKIVTEKTWRIQIKQEGVYFLSVRANETPLPEIASELSKRLKTPIVLSRVMEKQRVTLDFKDLPLEMALQMLAPVPYVHYELQALSPPVCREIFLNGYNEPPPVPKFENKHVSFVMEGDTESGVNENLRISYRNGQLSVTAKRQSLTTVLDQIAETLGVSFSMAQDTDETIDLNFKEVNFENLMFYFPASVRLHVRKDIQRLSTVPLLIEFVK